MTPHHLARTFNVDGSPWHANKEGVYGIHLDSFLRYLSLAWTDYYNYDFVVYFRKHKESPPKFPNRRPRTILIYLADEFATIPTEISRSFFAILKSYWPFPDQQNNIISFPHGYGNCITELCSVPFEKRTVDCFFSGYFNYNRLDLFRSFSCYRWLPPFPLNSVFARRVYWHLLRKTGLYQPGWRRTGDKMEIYFTPSFADGLTHKAYASHLANSRIVLCPRGHVSAESFRLFEAASVGCVVISDPLPQSHWYQNAPYITCHDWLNIRRTVHELCADDAHLHELHRATVNWWQKRLSDKPAAEYVARCLQALKDEPIR